MISTTVIFQFFILPFGAYFLLSLNEAAIPILRKWYIKAGLVFALTVFAEIGQLFGIQVLGATFDPVDILVYGFGVLAAAFLDVRIFSRYLGFWATPNHEHK
jgi:hypothetical protein